MKASSCSRAYVMTSFFVAPSLSRRWARIASWSADGFSTSKTGRLNISPTASTSGSWGGLEPWGDVERGRSCRLAGHHASDCSYLAAGGNVDEDVVIGTTLDRRDERFERTIEVEEVALVRLQIDPIVLAERLDQVALERRFVVLVC